MTFGEIVAEAERERHAGGMPQPAKQEDVARSERVESGPAIKLAKTRTRVSKREREAAE